MGGALERLPFISRRRALFKIQSEAGSEWQPYFCLSSFTQNCGPGGLFRAHLLREITLVMAQNWRCAEVKGTREIPGVFERCCESKLPGNE